MCKDWALRLLNRVALCAPLLMPAQNASADTAWVAANALNLRSGPGTEYARVATLSACTRVDVVGYANGWAMVRRGGKDYWVAGNYLSVAPCNTAPPDPGLSRDPARTREQAAQIHRAAVPQWGLSRLLIRSVSSPGSGNPHLRVS